MMVSRNFREIHGRRGVWLLLLISGAVLAGPAAGADTIPIAELRNQGDLASAAADFIEAFNANDPDLLHAFMSTYRDAESLTRTPVEARVQRQQQFRGMLGELTLNSIVQSEQTVLEVIVHAATPDGFFQLSFEASSLDPLQIASMGMRPALAPEEQATGEDDVLAATETLEALVDAALTRYDLPALALAVGDDTDAVEIVVCGVRDVDSGDPVALDDRFHIGSLTKSMTAAVAARLIARGVLDWDDKLGERLDLTLNPTFHDVTLTLLLQHRGGLDPLLDVAEQDETRWRKAADEPAGQRLALLRDILTREPAVAPGSAFAYSNAGYVAAAAMLEQTAGRPWEILVAQEVFKPLGLASADLGWPATVGHPQQPRGHWFENGSRRVQEFTGYNLDGPLAPAGDVQISIGDLARYGQAHLQALAGASSWLTSEDAHTLHATPEEGAPTGYAMGWAIEEIEGEVGHLHAGSAGTFYAFLCLFPETGRVVAIAMNDGNLGNDAVARELVRQVKRIRGDVHK